MATPTLTVLTGPDHTEALRALARLLPELGLDGAGGADAEDGSPTVPELPAATVLAETLDALEANASSPDSHAA